MRTAIIHNFYASATPSGENVTVRELTAALRQKGHDITLFSANSDAISDLPLIQKAKTALNPVFPLTDGGLMRRLKTDRFDILQFHNVYPFFSPAILASARPLVGAITHVVHNFRHTCVAGSHFRDGAPCFDCPPRRLGGLPGIRHSCYRGSRTGSVVMTASNALYHDQWRNINTSTISGFMRRYLLASGFRDDRVVTIGNPVGSACDPAPDRSRLSRDLLFAGRLEPEKGLAPLLQAWTQLPQRTKAGSTLHIAGSGRLEPVVKTAASIESDIVFHGRLSEEALSRLGLSCGATVVPSIWDEPFGRTVVEAFRSGRGVVATSFGALPELVEDGRTGWICDGTPDGMALALTRCLTSDLAQIGAQARSVWLAHHTREAVAQAYSDWWTSLLDRDDI